MLYSGGLSLQSPRFCSIQKTVNSQNSPSHKTNFVYRKAHPKTKKQNHENKKIHNGDACTLMLHLDS